MLLLIPITVLGYSDHLIASGENVGIKLNANNILIIGKYEIDGVSPANDANLEVGDKIFSINDKNVSSIDEFEQVISNNSLDTIKIGYIRNNKKYYTNLKLINNKTGLYVKDSVVGIGTLTFIDPNTLTFGALGHEITEAGSDKVLSIKDGIIFESNIIGIEPSIENSPGEKRATLDINNVFGSIYKNTNKGIVGKYLNNIDSKRLYKVANISDIKIGPAKILTVIENNNVYEADINILNVTVNSSKTKNIVFEITDKYLLSKTGGIVQGMSGSPIIQGDFIIGAVTHVLVNDPKKGYGIIITNMLEEAEKTE